MSFSLRASHQNNCELRYEDQNIYSNRKTIIYTKELLGFVEPSFVWSSLTKRLDSTQIMLHGF